MGTVVQFPSRKRPPLTASGRRTPMPPWALPSMMAIAWSQAYSLALLDSLQHRPRKPDTPSAGNHVVLPWRGPRKRA